MPTVKKRINVTLPNSIAVIIKEMSQRDDVTMSKTIVDLLERAIEIDEDMICSRIAKERLKNMKGTISSQQFWSQVRV